ncbi:MAG: metallophosphoesterase [Bacteroidales bacterium]|nr:metallophosphoesterase [Bacteroidales bacterium]
MAFLIFFSIVFTIYFSVHYYLFTRLSMALPGTQGLALYFKIGFWMLAFSFIAGRFLEKIWLSELTMGITIIGSYWLAAMLYFLLAVLLIDIIRLADYYLPFIPSFITGNLYAFKRYLLLSVITVIGIMITYGAFNARKPVIREFTLSIPKPAGNFKELNIALVSDLHLGSILANRHMDRIVNKINGLNPDLILMAGDVFDEDLNPVIQKNLGSGLKQLKSKLGVYAVTGNHEYIGGVDPAVDYLEKHGVQMIRDSAVLIENSFYLIGREDRDKPRFSGKPRKDLPVIMAAINKEYPLILMDHQPFTLNESLENGIDLHLSGHTHNGQIWPLNYIIDAIYEVGYGYVNKSGMHVYVSSGVGTWGPPVRIGTRPEIVNIRLRFSE